MKIKYKIKDLSKLELLLSINQQIIIKFTSSEEVQDFYKKYVNNLGTYTRKKGTVSIENTGYKTMENFSRVIFEGNDEEGILVYIGKIGDEVIHFGWNRGRRKETDFIYTIKDLFPEIKKL